MALTLALAALVSFLVSFITVKLLIRGAQPASEPREGSVPAPSDGPSAPYYNTPRLGAMYESTLRNAPPQKPLPANWIKP